MRSQRGVQPVELVSVQQVQTKTSTELEWGCSGGAFCSERPHAVTCSVCVWGGQLVAKAHSVGGGWRGVEERP